MQFFLFTGVLAIILQSTLTVDPGDPFPIDVNKPKPITSEDIINTDEVVKPGDHGIRPPSGPFVDSSDDERNAIIFTTTGINKVSETFIDESREDDDDDDYRDRQPLPLEKFSTSSFAESINTKNLIKIGRWRYVDLETKETRYWYETEGGRMGTGWTFDGFLFQAYNKSESGTEPVYAFHSELRGLWTNTIQMDPKAPLLGNDQWISDGVSFYTYRTSMNSSELRPVVRYWNKPKGQTTDLGGIRISYLLMKGNGDDDQLQNDRQGWTLDKILFYALPIEN